jgi:5'-nucleotidase
MKSWSRVVSLLVILVLPGLVHGGDTCDRFHVMVVNDDGIDAPGIAALTEALAADPSYRVTVVAPAEQQSVVGHGHVTRREVPVREHEPISGAPAWSVGGTPASVVRVALSALLANDLPKLVVSGINRGENDGLGAWTSGTVAAAREALLSEVPGIAASLQLDWDDPKPDFAGAARWVKPVVDAVRDSGLPEGVYLNVNVPRDIDTIRGYRLARMGLTPPALARFDEIREEAGARWYRSRWRPPETSEPGSDTRALDEGWVTIVPLGLDQTSYKDLALIQPLNFVDPRAAESAEATGESP